MEIDRKDTNIQIGKRLREAGTNMNKDKAEFAATLDVTEEHYRKLEAGATGLSVANSTKEQRNEFFDRVLAYLSKLIK